MEMSIKEHIQKIISRGSISKLLGPKKCREILSYISSPMMHQNISFLELWSFLLQRPIYINDDTNSPITWNVQGENTVAIGVVTKN
jgi:hypothetical protein